MFVFLFPFLTFGMQQQSNLTEIEILVEDSPLENGEQASPMTLKAPKKNAPTFNTAKDFETVSAAQVTEFGGVESVSLLGAPSEYTLAVYDGIVLNDSSSPAGGFDFSLLNLVGFTDTLVTLGSASVIYRGGGLGGVVEVRSQALKDGNAFVGGGEWSFGNGSLVHAKASHSAEGTGLQVFAGSRSRWGSSALSSWRGNAEEDESTNSVGGMQGRMRINQRASLQALIYFNYKNEDIDNFEDDDSNNIVKTAHVVSAALGEYIVNENYRQNLILYSVLTDRKNTNPEDVVHPGQSFRFHSLGLRNSLEWQNVLSVSQNWIATIGLGISQDMFDIKSKSEFSDQSFESKTDKKKYPRWIYAEWDFSTQQEGLRIGARVEDDDEQISHTLSATHWHSFFNFFQTGYSLSYAEKTPSLFQRYSDFGNEDLKKENARTATVALKLGSKLSFFKFMTFYTAFRNMILFDENLGLYKNIGKAETKGVTLDAQLTYSRLTFLLNYLYLDTRDMTNKRALPLRPHHKIVSKIVAKANDKTSFYTSGTYQSLKKQWLGTREFKLPEVAIFEVGASYQLQSFSVYSRVENVFDKKYENYYGYAAPRRAIVIGGNFEI